MRVAFRCRNGTAWKAERCGHAGLRTLKIKQRKVRDPKKNLRFFFKGNPKEISEETNVRVCKVKSEELFVLSDYGIAR